MRAATIRLALLGALLTLASVACDTGASDTQQASDTATVESVTDGDTLRLTDGRRVRLVQIDAPEVDENECYAEEAAAALERLVRPGSRVRLEADPALDDRDRFGRELRYVFVGDANLNEVLVRDGAAGVWFFDGEMGRYASELLVATLRARTDRRGLWGACPGTAFNPYEGIDTD